jgi:Glycosyl hydrolases family 25
VTITVGPDGTEYVPVIDISRHQGTADLAAPRARGVEGLIIRSNHAHVVDERCSVYLAGARAAGWRDDQIGFYTFCNPKRAGGYHSGAVFVDTVRRIFGRTDTLLMLDIESYTAEPGEGPVLQGPPFAEWIREHIRAIVELAPDATLIGYSNAAFYDPWVGDAALARSLEWIVPRFPVYPSAAVRANPVLLAAWVLQSPKPPDPSSWATFAFKHGPTGPRPPANVRWEGWQFSAGWNRQGNPYGFQSGDLDLNIVRVDTWRRWTGTAPLPPPPPPPPGLPADQLEERSMRIKVQPEDVWFEKVGLDLRPVGSGDEYAALPGAECFLDKAEMVALINTTRYTEGHLRTDAANNQAARMGPEFVALWEANQRPAFAPGGPVPGPSSYEFEGVVRPVG